MASSLKLGLLLSLCLPGLGAAQQAATAPAKPAVTTDALLNSPLTTPLDQAAGFSPLSSSWNITGGYQWRQIGDLNFKTGSRAAQGSLPWRAGKGRSGATTATTATTGSNANAIPGTAGPAGAYADRTYDDGYVNQIGLTPGYGDTWWWGYNNASQIDASQPSAKTVTYHLALPGGATTTTASYSTRSSRWSGLGNDLNWDSDLAGSGWFARMESPAVYVDGPLAVSLELGYSFASADAMNRKAGVFMAHQENEQRKHTTRTRSTDTLIDTYDLFALEPPQAPYFGTEEGPGILLPNIPATRTITAASASNGGTIVKRTTADFFSEVSESLDVDLHTISLGPHFSWERRRLRMGLSTGLAINIADWDAGYQEELFVSKNGGRAQLLGKWQDHENGTRVLPGFYIEANVDMRLTDRVSLFGGGRYDWTGALSETVGPSSFDLDLGGWSVQGGITFSF